MTATGPSTRSTSTRGSSLRGRLARLVVGLLLFGGGIGLTGASGLGVGPWDVLHQGIGDRIGVPFGTVGIAVSGLVLLLWIPLRLRPGIGTLLNAVLVGLAIDATVWAVAEPDGLPARWALLLGGLLVMGVGSAVYLGAGLGAGARDGLMVGIHERGLASLRAARTAIEVSVLVAGWLLGGTVGPGTLLAAFAIGPLVQLFLPRFDLTPPVEPAR